MRELQRVPDEVMRMAMPDEDAECVTWPEQIDQTCLTIDRFLDDGEMDDGF